MTENRMSRGRKILEMVKMQTATSSTRNTDLFEESYNNKNYLDFIRNFEPQHMILEDTSGNYFAPKFNNDIVTLENVVVDNSVQEENLTNVILSPQPINNIHDTIEAVSTIIPSHNGKHCQEGMRVYNESIIQDDNYYCTSEGYEFPNEFINLNLEDHTNIIKDIVAETDLQEKVTEDVDFEEHREVAHGFTEAEKDVQKDENIVKNAEETREMLVEIGEAVKDNGELVLEQTSENEEETRAVFKEVGENAEDNRKVINEETLNKKEGGTRNNENRSMLYTKKGEFRKRKKSYESQSAKKQKMLEKLSLNHTVLPPCTTTCKKQCFMKIDQTRRQQLNEEYWKLTWTERHLFIKGSIECTAVKRRTIEISNKSKLKRTNSNAFLLKDKNGSLISVCRTFFLTTFGYTKNNNTIIKTSLSYENGSISSRVVDKRGKHSNRKNVDRVLLEKHVKSFQPCISHYRREHAPHRKYLPSDITIVKMHKDFTQNYKNIDCSYYTYRAFVKDVMKISFTKLGHEECEQCEIFKQHNNDHSENNMDLDNCASCMKWNTHIKKAKEARKRYRADAESTEWTATNICVSADLQKVVMLPRIDTFKQVLFTQRIIAFNESFVGVGKIQKNLGPVAVIWHEGVAGRKKEDICSAFHKYLLNQRDATSIKIWLDNCAGQNKNWTLYSFLSYIINSPEISANTIEIYYFEPGHSFMSADSFHHQVEQSMNSYHMNSSPSSNDGGKVYDFNDFKSAIEQIKTKGVKALTMEISDFKDWKDNSSLAKIKKQSPRPYLSDIVKLKFERGSFNMWYSCGYDSSYKELNFLTAKYLKNTIGPNSRTLCRGITRERKEGILKKLCPLMPENRRIFWEELSISDEAVDLTENIDD